MSTSVKRESISELPTLRATDVKRIGWRGVMETIAAKGKLVVTNHDKPQAVILSTAEYESMLATVRSEHARKEAILSELFQRLGEHLAPLEAPDAGERLRAALREPSETCGKTKAGSSF